MNPFALLMGQQAAPEIVVPGARQTAVDPGDPYADFSLNNSDAIRERVAAAQDGADAAEHEGLFGVKGTLRDVLGTIGDAFLIQSGNSPLYHNRRQQEKLGDAMTGYSVNPQAAAERMSGVSPQAAMGMAQLGAAQQKALTDARNKVATNDRMGVKDSRDAYETGAGMFGSFMGSLNKDTYNQAVPVLQAMKERFGLGDEFQIPDQYDPDLAKMYQYGGMPTSRQVTAAQADRRGDQRDEQIGINKFDSKTRRQNANTSRSVRRPPNPTKASMAEAYMRIPEDQRTADQQAVIDDFAGRNKGKSKSSNKTLGGARKPREYTVNGRTFRLKQQ